MRPEEFNLFKLLRDDSSKGFKPGYTVFRLSPLLGKNFGSNKLKYSQDLNTGQVGYSYGENVSDH